jgi:hypothetical protein
MARKPPRWLVHVGVAVASWVAALSIAQAVLGPDIERAAHRVEEQFELQLRGLGAPADPLPERSHEEAPIAPWELVSV